MSNHNNDLSIKTKTYAAFVGGIIGCIAWFFGWWSFLAIMGLIFIILMFFLALFP